MFCPNCGNDCADAMFCSECGSAVFLTEDTDKPAPPMGRYEGIDGYIELSFYTLTIHKEILGITVEHVMPYHDIADVVFRQASTSGNGYLVIREKEASYLPVENELDASCDERTIIFGKKKNSPFCKLNTYLHDLLEDGAVRECATKNAESTRTQDIADRGRILCPKCGSDRCYVRPYDTIRLNKYDSCLLIKLLAMGVALHYFFQGRKRVYVCKKCGYQWSK